MCNSTNWFWQTKVVTWQNELGTKNMWTLLHIRQTKLSYSGNSAPNIYYPFSICSFVTVLVPNKYTKTLWSDNVFLLPSSTSYASFEIVSWRDWYHHDSLPNQKSILSLCILCSGRCVWLFFGQGRSFDLPKNRSLHFLWSTCFLGGVLGVFKVYHRQNLKILIHVLNVKRTDSIYSHRSSQSIDNGTLWACF